MVNRSSSMCPARLTLTCSCSSAHVLSLSPLFSFPPLPCTLFIYLHNCQTFVATDELALSVKRRVRECYAVCVRVCVCWLRLSVYRYHQQAPHADEHTHTRTQKVVKGVRTVRVCECVCVIKSHHIFVIY